jgi:hypothetical protein
MRRFAILVAAFSVISGADALAQCSTSVESPAVVTNWPGGGGTASPGLQQSAEGTSPIYTYGPFVSAGA